MVYTNYIFVHLLDNKVFQSLLMHGTNMNILTVFGLLHEQWFRLQGDSKSFSKQQDHRRPEK